MVRTLGTTRARRALANAACGRTAVILYVCLPDGEDPEPFLLTLRRYVAARDWTTALEVTEQAPLTTPFRMRPHWPSMAALLASGAAQGLVTPTFDMWSSSTEEARAVRNWLEDHHSFLATTHKTTGNEAAIS
ncbi:MULTISPECIES: hypothetical protein [unclassified Streptomyces]|uniref:hypothetical protein n=1 Tax=unclassified Streptomyces TaxID=2593676 RepID=UPI002DDBD191|nr:hypothetical protein [Streptomyces sp. NBC_01795]WSA97735.1 hypothetical protein OIE63_40320 [Streptomyces sp. NBC_01795]WSS46748.1 hypothetical protein OG220_39900 [Streptomyces sp. NBC_01187]WSS47035.1 hypothetical protein OG220_41725 [Streptomyces sp. NBC_01187]